MKRRCVLYGLALYAVLTIPAWMGVWLARPYLWAMYVAPTRSREWLAPVPALVVPKPDRTLILSVYGGPGPFWRCLRELVREPADEAGFVAVVPAWPCTAPELFITKRWHGGDGRGDTTRLVLKDLLVLYAPAQYPSMANATVVRRIGEE